MILYLDCLRGIDAVAVLAALVDAGVEAPDIAGHLRSLPGNVGLGSSESVVDGFRVRRIEISLRDVPDCRKLEEIVALIDRGDLSPGTRAVVLSVYQRLAAAEARVHGSTVDAVTFHEIGAARSVVAVLGTAVALEILGVARVISSPMPVGAGFVETDHGRLPVPTPATLELLRGLPVMETARGGELVTPTGAAIVAEIGTSFGAMPSMTVEHVGYGVDQRRSPALVTRVVVGSEAFSMPAR